LVGQLGRAVMSRVFQRLGRPGYYIDVSVPYELRSKFSTNSIQRKLGRTHKEALAKRLKVEAEIQRMFGAALNTASLVEKVQAAYELVPELKGVPLNQLPYTDKENLTDAYPNYLDDKGDPIDPQEAALWKALDGKSTWHEWVNRRAAIENRAKSTVLGWRSNLKALSTWAGTDYLADLTKSKAIEYKEYMLTCGKEPSTVKHSISCLNGFWNWGIDNELMKENIWSGLKKRLPDSNKEKIPPPEVFSAATKKASTTSARRKEIDYQFLIQRYTGCRQGEAAGLRHSDIDLKNRMITFEEWEKIVRYEKIRGGKRTERQIRKFKTGKKDERVVPINSALYEVLKDMPLKLDSDDPIWPRRYKAITDHWGEAHVGEYKTKYNLKSHQLRKYAITKLELSGKSTPGIIWEIVRHKIPGASEVTIGYLVPTPEELREAMEILI